MEEINEDEVEAFEAYVDVARDFTDWTDYLLDNFHSAYLQGVYDDYSLGVYACDNEWFTIPDELSCYIDYKAIGRDLVIDSIYESNGYYFDMAV